MAGRLVFTTVLLLLALTCVQSRFLKWQPQHQQAGGSSSDEDGPARQQDGSDESDDSDDSDSSEEQMAAATTVQPDPATAGPMETTRSSGLPMGTTLPPAPLETNQPEDDATDYVTEMDFTDATVTCMMNCPLDPSDIGVCGTDGVTYQSECVLTVESCRRGDTLLEVAYAGPCATLSPNAP